MINHKKETVFEIHKKIEKSVINLIKNHYTEETWNSFSLERQVSEIIKFVDDIGEIKSICLDESN